MEQIHLGDSALSVSRLGLGGCPFGGHGWGDVYDANSINAIRAALDEGISFFDTADVYGFGHSEELLSRALGKQRHEMVIATKFGVRWDEQSNIVKDISRQYLRQALEASLRRLRVDCIPLYYVHWPDGRTPIEEAVQEMERCRQQGKVRAIGVSNFGSNQIRKASAVANVACVQVQLSLVDDQPLSLKRTLQETGSSLVTWGSLAQGLLSGKYDANSYFGENDRRSRYENFQGEKFARNLHTVEVIKRVAAQLGKSPAQVAIRWLLDTPIVSCVLYGAKSPQQVRENSGASGWSLSHKDYQLLANSHQVKSTSQYADVTLSHDELGQPSI